MPLRIEEHLEIADVRCARALEIGPGKVVEILLRAQYRHALIVDVEKILEPGEMIGTAQRVHRVIGETNAVSPRQGEEKLGLEAAFHMDMQLAFGQAVDQIRAGRQLESHDERQDGSLPSMPAASQFMPAISPSLSAWPSFTLICPPWSLIGPLKMTILPVLMPSSAALAALTTSGGMLV